MRAPAGGGLCVIPGSHRHPVEDALCARAPGARVSADFVPVPEGDDSPLLRCPAVRRAGSSQRLIAAGDLIMILWDSRTVHCNTPALSVLSAECTGTDPSL